MNFHSVLSIKIFITNYQGKYIPVCIIRIRIVTGDPGLVIRPNDNHSPGPVIREVSP